jgi:hypothetical protein
VKLKARERRYLARLLGESANGRGKLSEELLLQSVRRSGSEFDWFLFARPALADEDCKGIDIVVFCRGGLRLFLQAKSSNGKAKAFASKKRKEHIEVVVVSLDEGRNLKRAKEALERAYAKAIGVCGIDVGAQASRGT